VAGTENPVKRPDNMHSPMTRRQQQVMNLTVAGLSNKEIASELGLKEQVVKNYLKIIFTKMGVESRVRLILQYYAKPIRDYRASRGLPG
jgi:DNA-binding NarL/FixJ family response regulator